MSDYTPETAEVRAAWLDAHRTDAEGGGFEREGRPRERLREFERWLATHDAEVWDRGYESGADDQAECEGYRYFDTPERRALGFDHWTPNPYRKVES